MSYPFSIKHSENRPTANVEGERKNTSRYAEYHDETRIIDVKIAEFNKVMETSVDIQIKEDIRKFKNWHSLNLLFLIIAIEYKQYYDSFDEDGLNVVMGDKRYKNYKINLMHHLNMKEKDEFQNNMFDQQVYSYMKLSYQTLN